MLLKENYFMLRVCLMISIKLFIVLCAILISGSLYYATYLKNTFLIFFLILISFFYILQLIRTSPKSFSFCKKKILYLIIIPSVVFINQNFVFTSSGVLFLCLLCSFLITEIISFENFSEIFLRIILFLCISSWLAIPVIYFNLISPFADFVSITSQKYSNFIFFGILNNDSFMQGELDFYYNRISGLFWEPGAFQIFINIAYFLSLIKNNFKFNMLHFLVFFITLLLSQSTAGLLVFFLLSLLGSFYKNRIFVLLVFVSLFFIDFSPFFGKFYESSNSYVSFSSRLLDNKIDFYRFLGNPLTGVGYGNYWDRLDYIENANNSGATGSDGIILLLSYLGLPALFIIYPLLFPVYMRKQGLIHRLLFSLAFFIMFNNENFFPYLLPWILIFYGISSGPNYLKGGKK